MRGERVTLSKVDAFADGVAIKLPGAEPFRLCLQLLDGTVLVDNSLISTAIKVRVCAWVGRCCGRRCVARGLFVSFQLPPRLSDCHQPRPASRSDPTPHHHHHTHTTTTTTTGRVQ